jgi:hypothetical protein
MDGERHLLLINKLITKLICCLTCTALLNPTCPQHSADAPLTLDHKAMITLAVVTDE